MADREKVMRGLEACNRKRNNGSDCENCPYYDDEDTAELPFGICNIQDMFDDALDLLKEQEPRVMTPDEICGSRRPFTVYAENWDGELFQVAYIGGKYLDIDGKQCPERVRFWTSRPTEEQRKAVKWGD